MEKYLELELWFEEGANGVLVQDKVFWFGVKTSCMIDPWCSTCG